MTDNMTISFATGPYDRLEALHDGTVAPEGITLDSTVMWPPRLIFDRLAGEHAYDVAEFSCSEYICLIDRGITDYIALPVFPSRVFRHGFICVRRDSGIDNPKDLERRRIGVPLYTQTAAIWIRGLLEDEYGVDLSGVRWLQGSVMDSGAHGSPSASPMRQAPEIEINGTGRPLAALLAAGEIDAILGTFIDDAVRAYPDIVRLIPDYRAVERDYFRRTGVFPIMHLVVMRRALLESEEWTAGVLFRAFEEAKEAAQQKLRSANAQHYMLPWLLADIEELDAICNGDAFPYGIEANRRTLETLVRYMHRQGFIEREIPLEELFVPLAAS